MKRLITLATLVVSLFLLTTSATAAPLCSDWALPYVEQAREEGLVTLAYFTEDLSAPLTRYDMATLLTQAYETLSGKSYRLQGDDLAFEDLSYLYDSDQLSFPVEAGIMVGTSDSTFSPGDTLTRQQFAKIIISLWDYVESPSIDLNSYSTPSLSDFSQVADWAKPYVALAVEQGFLSGYDDGTFGPNDSVTWEQVLTVLTRMLSLGTGDIPVITSHADGDVISTDSNLMVKSNLDSPHVAYLICLDGTVYTSAYDLLEDAAQLSYKYLTRSVRYTLVIETDGYFSDPVTLYVGQQQSIITTQVDKDTNMVTIEIDPLTAGTHFSMNIVEDRTGYSNPLIEPQQKLSVFLGDTTTYSFQGDCSRQYEITLTSWNETLTTTVYTYGPQQDADIVAGLYEMGGFSSSEEAAAAMVTVEIPAWKLVNGEKVAGTSYVSVHPLLADVVLEIFQEIFDGPEQFPIKDIGGYSWRGDTSTSTHNSGIAIDINADENMCVYANGTTVGSCWEPYENPYSITPYGDVVRAFENHGFIWGGDAWSSPQDYMHFNYLNYLG